MYTFGMSVECEAQSVLTSVMTLHFAGNCAHEVGVGRGHVGGVR
jgi:hypothetical protein